MARTGSLHYTAARRWIKAVYGPRWDISQEWDRVRCGVYYVVRDADGHQHVGRTPREAIAAAGGCYVPLDILESRAANRGR